MAEKKNKTKITQNYLLVLSKTEVDLDQGEVMYGTGASGNYDKCGLDFHTCKRTTARDKIQHCVLSTFFVMAFGSVPNCGASAGRSTGLFISDGTDSVLRILATGREIANVTMYIQSAVCPVNCKLSQTYLVERRFCRMGLPLCICCGTLTCTESRRHMRDAVLCHNTPHGQRGIELKPSLSSFLILHATTVSVSVKNTSAQLTDSVCT